MDDNYNKYMKPVLYVQHWQPVHFWVQFRSWIKAISSKWPSTQLVEISSPTVFHASGCSLLGYSCCQFLELNAPGLVVAHSQPETNFSGPQHNLYLISFSTNWLDWVLLSQWDPALSHSMRLFSFHNFDLCCCCFRSPMAIVIGTIYKSLNKRNRCQIWTIFCFYSTLLRQGILLWVCRRKQAYRKRKEWNYNDGRIFLVCSRLWREKWEVEEKDRKKPKTLYGLDVFGSISDKHWNL